MELDRASRILEMVVCLFWVAAFFLRVRGMQVAADGSTFAERVGPVLRPLQIATGVIVLLSVPLWLQGRWQPFAHALFIPTLVAGGIVQGLATLGRRRG